MIIYAREGRFFKFKLIKKIMSMKSSSLDAAEANEQEMKKYVQKCEEKSF